MIRRTLAYLVDLMVLIAAYMVFAFIAQISFIAQFLHGLAMVGFWFYGALLCFTWLYFAGFESSKRSATIGKSLFNLRVTTLEGTRISFGLATARYFLKAFFRIGIICIPFSKKRQALHDMIVKTTVS